MLTVEFNSLEGGSSFWSTFLGIIIGGAMAGLVATFIYTTCADYMALRRFKRHYKIIRKGSKEFTSWLRDDLNVKAFDIKLRIIPKQRKIYFDGRDSFNYSYSGHFIVDSSLRSGEGYYYYSKLSKKDQDFDSNKDLTDKDIQTRPFGFCKMFYLREENIFFVMDHHAKHYSESLEGKIKFKTEDIRKEIDYHKIGRFESYVWAEKKNDIKGIDVTIPTVDIRKVHDLSSNA